MAAGVIIGAIGLDGIRHVRRRAELALAALPLILAGHQFVEAFVWWGLEDHVPQPLGRFAVWLYLAVASRWAPLSPRCCRTRGQVLTSRRSKAGTAKARAASAPAAIHR
jgi:uncharacterized protein DUF6629